MVANLKVYSPSRVFALLFELFKQNWPTTIEKYARIIINHATASEYSLVYFEIHDHVCKHKNSLL